MIRTPRLIYPQMTKTKVSINEFMHYSDIIESTLKKEHQEILSMESESDVYTPNPMLCRSEFVFPEIHRVSMLISIFSFFEKELVLLAHMYERANDPTLKLEDFKKERGIDKVKEFFTKSIGIRIPTGSNWNLLKHFQNVRNQFVHNPYKVLNSENKSLPSFKSLKTIQLTEYKWDYSYYYNIKITKDTIDQLQNIIESYFDELYEVLISYDDGKMNF